MQGWEKERLSFFLPIQLPFCLFSQADMLTTKTTTIIHHHQPNNFTFSKKKHQGKIFVSKLSCFYIHMYMHIKYIVYSAMKTCGADWAELLKKMCTFLYPSRSHNQSTTIFGRDLWFFLPFHNFFCTWSSIASNQCILQGKAVQKGKIATSTVFLGEVLTSSCANVYFFLDADHDAQHNSKSINRCIMTV